MADHLDAPGLKSPNGDARTDITDVYAFQKSGDPGKSILMLNVNPLAPTLAAEFRQDAVYDLLIDTDGDARADISFRVTFSEKRNGQQFAQVVRTERHPGGDDDDQDPPNPARHDGEHQHLIVEH